MTIDVIVNCHAGTPRFTLHFGFSDALTPEQVRWLRVTDIKAKVIKLSPKESPCSFLHDDEVIDLDSRHLTGIELQKRQSLLLYKVPLVLSLFRSQLDTGIFITCFYTETFQNALYQEVQGYGVRVKGGKF
jgi:hypothetical protein